MRYHKISDETVGRLPIYLRGLEYFSEKGQKDASSRDLAEFLGVNSWLIRKDFSYFGSFGTPGVGYNIEKVIKQINKILKLDVSQKVVLVGAGNLGTAVLAYPGFKIYGFNVAAAFDLDPKKVGRKINNIAVKDISNIGILRKQKIRLGIIAVPRSSAQTVADVLVKAGIKGILNFAPCHINVPKKIKVITIDIALELARLPDYMPAG